MTQGAAEAQGIAGAAHSVVSTPPLDVARLGAWLQAEVPGVDALRDARRLVGGNSNPIWHLRAASGEYILRTQPAGQLLKSAHALDREHRILCALQGTAVPVPRMHVLCNDLSVVGVQFYLMDFVPGTVHRHVALPDVPHERRRAVYDAAIDTLATLHRSDIDALGLRDFGRSGNYFERQMHRWGQQYRTAMPEGDAAMDALMVALEKAMPHGEHPVVLLHGDSRLDNLMFAAASNDGAERVVAVLDWELSTLGHPLADLGQFLAVQDLPHDYLLPGLAGVDRAAQGLPTQAELRDRYLGAMGMDPGVDMRFFKAFAMFRQAAMSAGLRRRAALGTAVAESALQFGRTMDVFARVGLEALERAD